MTVKISFMDGVFELDASEDEMCDVLDAYDRMFDQRKPWRSWPYTVRLSSWQPFPVLNKPIRYYELAGTVHILCQYRIEYDGLFYGSWAYSRIVEITDSLYGRQLVAADTDLCYALRKNWLMVSEKHVKEILKRLER